MLFSLDEWRRRRRRRRKTARRRKRKTAPPTAPPIMAPLEEEVEVEVGLGAGVVVGVDVGVGVDTEGVDAVGCVSVDWPKTPIYVKVALYTAPLPSVLNEVIVIVVVSGPSIPLDPVCVADCLVVLLPPLLLLLLPTGGLADTGHSPPF